MTILDKLLGRNTMTDTPTKVIVNCETGEQTVVPLSAEEIADMQAAAEAAAEAQAKADAEAAAVAAAKQSAQDKLKALGLSDTEIAALTGI